MTSKGFYFKDKGFESDYKWLQGKLPGMELAMGLGARAMRQTWLVTAYQRYGTPA